MPFKMITKQLAQQKIPNENGTQSNGDANEAKENGTAIETNQSSKEKKFKPF